MCPACMAGLHEECYDFVDDCCCENTPATLIKEIGGPTKSDAEIKDATSTGRKRAAVSKPIIEGQLCDWAYLRYAGGGAIPIVGCNGTTLTQKKGSGVRTGNIHHGPDKSTLNNTDENLHRVCTTCHNRWHTLNDPLYPSERPDNGQPYLPIDGEARPHDRFSRASELELKKSDEYWNIPKGERPIYEEFVYDVEPARG